MTNNKGKKRSGSIVREVEYISVVNRRGGRKLMAREVSPTPSPPPTPISSPSKSTRGKSTRDSESPTKQQKMLDDLYDSDGPLPPPSFNTPRNSPSTDPEILQKGRTTKVWRASFLLSYII